MNYRLEMRTDNAAFGESVLERGAEIARILRDAADRAERGSIGGTIRDANGNTVGDFIVYTNARGE